MFMSQEHGVMSTTSSYSPGHYHILKVSWTSHYCAVLFSRKLFSLCLFPAKIQICLLNFCTKDAKQSLPPQASKWQLMTFPDSLQVGKMTLRDQDLFFFFLIYFGCIGSSFLCEGFLQLRQVGATLHRGAWASHYRGLSCCGAQAPDAPAQQLRLTGLVALRHVGSSQTRARTHVHCISRQILNHCATREAQDHF